MNETPLDFDFLILNRIPTLYSARRFQEEIDRHNLKGLLISPEDLSEYLSQNKTDQPKCPPILYRQGDFNFWKTHSRLLELPLKIINKPSRFIEARDKWITAKRWLKLKIPIPQTDLISHYISSSGQFGFDGSLSMHYEEIFEKIQIRFGIPFVIKKRFSSQGKEVFFINDFSTFFEILSNDAKDFNSACTLELNYFKTEIERSLGNPPNLIQVQLQRWIVQKCVQECLGYDVRSFQIQDVSFPIERRNSKSFQSNLHQGGQAFETKLTQKEHDYCKFIQENSALTYSGIDFLRTANGPMFLEINPSPGFEGIEKIHSKSIAKMLIDLL